MTLEDLDKQDACKHLLEQPAPLVVGELIVELRKYVQFVEDVKEMVEDSVDEDTIDELTELFKKHDL